MDFKEWKAPWLPMKHVHYGETLSAPNWARVIFAQGLGPTEIHHDNVTGPNEKRTATTGPSPVGASPDHVAGPNRNWYWARRWSGSGPIVGTDFSSYMGTC
jgi:hypothetical protein